jgi:hypothetical protein
MSTKRTPTNRLAKKIRVTPEILATFKKIVELERLCTCPPINPAKYWAHREECVACREFWVLEERLGHLLHLRPWEFPSIERPGSVELADFEAQERYRALAHAVALAEREGVNA